MKIAVASGKGGTGKTLISTNLFNVVDDVIYLDCDVEEPNGHIFLKSKQESSESVYIAVPKIDDEKCTYCGRCGEVCKFNAIIVAKQKVLVFPELCHGCGSCSYFCPQQAITENPREIGKIETADFNNKKVYTGRLNIGEPMAPPVIKKLKHKADNFDGTIIYDSPPGTSCPVIETLKGVDFVVLVTEPTPFGLNDLKLAVEVVRKLNIPMGIVVNKSGLGGTIISDYCKAENIKLLLEIPHADEIAKKYSRGELITQDEKYKIIFEKLYQDIKTEISQ
jgi:MinD superfamily P-loop ATPase